MNPLPSLRSLTLVLPLLLLALAIPPAALGQPVTPGPPELVPEARARLARAAEDARLAPWQRDLMLRLARTGTVAVPDSSEADRSATQPALVSGAGDGAWVAAAIRPIARGHHSAIYDPARDRMVVFGGDDNSSAHFGDVWALSLAGTPAWTQLTPTGTPPSARTSQSAIYDPVRDRMVIFGGSDGTVLYDEVWALALAGRPAWTQLTPTGTPPSARSSHSAIYDPVRDRMVVFGGYKNNGYLNDAWALSLAGTPAWTQLAPTGTPPVTRWGHSAIYDPVRGRMVVFGGYVFGGQEVNDVWALSLADTPAWTQLTPTGTPPSGRCDHSAIYDPVRDRMVMFGGVNPFLNDVWALSLAGTPAWTQLTPAGTLVSVRSSHSAIYDPVRDRMVVFAGVYKSSPWYLGDIWSLSLAGTPTWTQLTPTGTPPSARGYHSAIYDPVRNRMVVFGGYGGSYLNDVWTLSLGDTPAWMQLTPTGALPSGRCNHSAIYDPVRDRMVVFGGGGPNSLNEVWALSLAGTPAWTQLMPAGTPPSARGAHSAIYDPVRDCMIIFGGRSVSNLNDVWTLSLADTPAWTQVTPAGTPPSERYYHSAIYDPVRDRMVIFGGYSNKAFRNEAWALSLAGSPAWTQLTPTGTLPSARDAHSAIWDPVRDRMVVFGGSTGSCLNDVPELAWDAPALASVVCPGDIVWIPGGTIAASYSITNPNGFAQNADYALTSGRDWPGFPISGSAAVGAGATVAVPIPVPVPDSAAAGRNPLSFHVTLRGVPQYAMCSHNLVGDAIVPVQLSLVSVQADPDRVRLIWYVADGSHAVATVYRRAAQEEWAALGKVSSDGAGLMVYEDRTVSRGGRYGYRIGVRDEGQEVFAGETWVEVPASAADLAVVVPNPVTAGQVTVSFAAPAGRRVRVALVDVAGREVATQQVAGTGVRQSVSLARSSGLAQGVYLVRVELDRPVVARAAVIR
jgi:hypothetical protein